VEAVGERTGSERSERLSPIYFNDSFKEFGWNKKCIFSLKNLVERNISSFL
jgi:hypothetical protein